MCKRIPFYTKDTPFEIQYVTGRTIIIAFIHVMCIFCSFRYRYLNGIRMVFFNHLYIALYDFSQYSAIIVLYICMYMVLFPIVFVGLKLFLRSGRKFTEKSSSLVFSNSSSGFFAYSSDLESMMENMTFLRGTKTSLAPTCHQINKFKKQTIVNHII